MVIYDSFPDLDMKILYSPINRGAGGARQYAIDITKEPYIIFYRRWWYIQFC